MQLLEPVRPFPFELYLPASQLVQEVEPVCPAPFELYLPAAQGVQELARAPLNVPAAQVSHCPSPLLYLSVHAEPAFAGLLYVPLAQGVQELAPAPL